QQIFFAGQLAAQVLGGIFGSSELIAFRTPFVVIHPIEDSSHGGSALAQHAFQPESIFGGMDLLAVLAADGGDEVGEGQSAFEEVDLAIKLQLVYGEKVPGKIEERNHFWRKQSLIAHVMDGEKRTGVAQGGIAGIK